MKAFHFHTAPQRGDQSKDIYHAHKLKVELAEILQGSCISMQPINMLTQPLGFKAS